MTYFCKQECNYLRLKTCIYDEKTNFCHPADGRGYGGDC